MVKVLEHPLVRVRIAELRNRATTSKRFRELIGELTTFLAYEALKDATMSEMSVMTPVAETVGHVLSERFVVVPIIRAGIGMLPAMLDVLPEAMVGMLGMQRNDATAVAKSYYSKVPRAKGGESLIVIDPMLATGGSACDAVAQVKRLGYRRIKFLSIISSLEGARRIASEHPDVEVYTAALDEQLNEHFYIVPGLGDAGDRIFGTKDLA